MDKAAIVIISKSSAKQLALLLPLFFIAVLLSVIIEQYVPNEFLETMLGNSIYWAIPIAAIVGIIFPIPRYITYPIAFALFIKGVGYGVVFALISGEVISESIVRDIYEIKLFGIKFFSTRLILSTIFIIVGGFLVEAIL